MHKSLSAQVVGMTSRDDRSRLHVEIPVETKQAMKDEDGPMWKLIDEGVRMALGLDEGSTEAAIERRLEEIDQERGEISEQIEELNARLDQLAAMEDDLEKRLHNIRERKESHDERLCTILDEMANDNRNRPAQAWMSAIKEAATLEYGSDSKNNIRRIFEDLRNAALEEDYAIESARLSRSASTQPQAAAADGGNDWKALSNGADGDGGESDE